MARPFQFRITPAIRREFHSVSEYCYDTLPIWWLGSVAPKRSCCMRVMGRLLLTLALGMQAARFR
jgi:hypothetical protein